MLLDDPLVQVVAGVEQQVDPGRRVAPDIAAADIGNLEEVGRDAGRPLADLHHLEADAGGLAQDGAAPAARSEGADRGHRHEFGADGQDGPVGGEVVRRRAGRRGQDHAVTDDLRQPLAVIDQDPDAGRLPRGTVEGDLVEGQRLVLGPGRGPDPRPERLQAGSLGGAEPRVEAGFRIRVHQKSDRPQVHAEDRQAEAAGVVQGLQHQPVAAEGDEKVGRLRRVVAMYRHQPRPRRRRRLAVGGQEAQAPVHAPPRPPGPAIRAPARILTVATAATTIYSGRAPRQRCAAAAGPPHGIRRVLMRPMSPDPFWHRPLARTDPGIAAAIRAETERQRDEIELIASENIVSPAVLEALGSPLTNKYAEGYPGRRYYGGCAEVDIAESLARDRARELFRCQHANVQPHSGAQANQAAFLALLKPGETLLGMDLAAGGHLTHGARPNLSGKWFRAAHYGVGRDTGRLDYDAIATLAARSRPRLVIAGGSAVPREIDFARFRAIADSVDAWLMVDMAHIAGLVAAGVHPSPLPHAHVVTSTTHKTLRGPRGGLVLSATEEIGRRIDSAVFPGLQGGPLMHVIAAKAVAFREALQPEFGDYARQVVANARILAETLVGNGLDIVSGGTDTHLLLADLRPIGVTGRDAEIALERAHLTCNKNGVPFDPLPPTVTSGIRLGTAAGTTRGFGAAEFSRIGEWIVRVLRGVAARGAGGDAAIEAEVRAAAIDLCRAFPVYPARDGTPAETEP